MKIAITGAKGMLGQALSKAFSKHSLTPLSSRDLDVTSLESVRRVVADLKPDWVIHAAAYTQVDAAEANSLEAYRVNALGTRNLAMAVHESGSRLAYYSTDYVFDGTQERPYREWDPANPLSVYGASKLAGEFFLRSLCPKHLIVRTSWLFGAGGPHFVGKIMAAAEKKKSLEVVSDQRGSPTFTTDLAYMTLCLVAANKSGTYHVTNSGNCSWEEFAREILTLCDIESEIRPINSEQLATPARRPRNSILNNYLLQLEGMPLLRPWQSALAAFLGKITP
ncbi:MAG: dTDP-4-dehydrorhamnose reductase [Acidobacteriota bacterium]